jgi:hypothetical protein
LKHSSTSMDRCAVMLSLIRRAPTVIIGIAALLCLNGALITLGGIALSVAPLSVDPIAGSEWTPPDLATPPSATRHAGPLEPDDPVLARPIFLPSRKPFEPPVAQAAITPPAPPRPPPPDPTFVVDGIMLTGGARKAHLRQLQETDGRWYEAGQDIDGWMIVQIDAGGIVVEQAERKLAIRLYSSDSRAFQVVRQSSQ